MPYDTRTGGALSPLALALVLASALSHATWNLLAKRSGGSLVFGWGQCLVGAACCLPLAVVAAWRTPVPAAGWPYLALTGALHSLYFWALTRAYRRGDLSLVYPVMRGSGLLLTLPAAALLLGEPISPQAAAGAGLVLSGLVAAHRHEQRGLPPDPRATAYALLAGLAMVGYNVADKLGVGVVSPAVYVLAVFLGPALALAPAPLGEPGAARVEWRPSRRAILAAGLLSPLAYLLVLLALSISRVSYLAPLREVGLVFGVGMAWLWLREPAPGRRLAGAALIAAGAAAIATAP